MKTLKNISFAAIGITVIGSLSGCSDNSEEYPPDEQGLSYLTDNEVGSTDESGDIAAGTTAEGLDDSRTDEQVYAPETVRDVQVNGEAYVGTVRFNNGSTELDSLAEESLNRLIEAVEEEAPARVTLRAVNPNDLDPESIAQVTKERTQTVRSYVEEQGLGVAEWDMEYVSAREFERASREDTDSNILSDDTAGDEPVQEVVITIVSVTQRTAN